MSSRERQREADRSRRRQDVNRDREVNLAGRRWQRRSAGSSPLLCCGVEGIAVPELGRVSPAAVEEAAEEPRPTGTPVEP